MLRWEDFQRDRPDLAEAGRDLLYRFGVGLAFLGTVRADGGPRLHPMCPVLVDGGLYGLLEPGPKRRDLDRDGRYAMHGFPPADNEDAFYITGHASRLEEAEVIDRVISSFWTERGKDEQPAQAAGQRAYEFLIDTCLLTRTTGHGDWDPQHTIWKATSA